MRELVPPQYVEVTQNASFFEREELGNPGRDDRHDVMRIGVPNCQPARIEPRGKKIGRIEDKGIDASKDFGEWIGFCRIEATLL
jgi:hypothetical protein